MNIFPFKKRPAPPKPTYVFLHVSAPAEGWADPRWSTDGALPLPGTLYGFRVVETRETDGNICVSFALCPIPEEARS